METLKLTYIAQGFHLSLVDRPFFKEKVYAWKYGPVIKELYQHLKIINIHNRINGKQDLKDSLFNEKQNNILFVVFKKYRMLNAWGLSRLTHMEGTPWQKAYIEGKETEIKLTLIKKHFKKIITPKSFIILLAQI